MNTRDRLFKYIAYKGLAIRAFEKSINVGNGYVNSISKSIQPDKLESISNLYPDLNLVWLLIGKGEMLNKIEEPSKSNESQSILSNELNKQNEHIDELLAQNRILIETLKSQTEIIKKTSAQPDEAAECADAS